MRIEAIRLREIRLPLVDYFETSLGTTVERRIILVTVRSEGVIGYGECTAEEEPLFNGETTETAWHIISDFVVPALLGKTVRRAADVAPLLRHIRGNPMARAAVETAVWDLEARRGNLPLSALLGGVRTEIPCGVSIGIRASLPELLEKVRREVDAGYRRIKIKIKPGWDLEPLGRVREEFPGIPLMADANSAYSLDDLPLLRRLDGLGLMMIEQPLAHDDIVDHAVLQKELQTPVCLDESIRTAEDARKAVEMGSCRVINVKLGRVGGFAEALLINDLCGRRGIPLWCGGMLESGIGRAHNIALSTLGAFSLPGDISASRRYYEEDTVRPPVEVGGDGMIRVPPGPGTGYQPDLERIARATVRERDFESTRKGAVHG